MGKIVLFNMVSVDGLFSGPGGSLDWHHVGPEFDEFAAQQLDRADGLLFGRVTFQEMAAYWPTPFAVENDPVIAKKMNEISKTVFSRTLEKVTWQNTCLVRSNSAEEARKLKEQVDKDLLIFGSANLARSLMRDGLIDEFRIMVNPLILGRGTPLFGGSGMRIDLKLMGTRCFENGNVLLSYVVTR